MPESINLLPWRQQLITRHQRRFSLMLVVAALMAVGIQWLIDEYLERHIQLLQHANQQLTSQVTLLDQQLTLAIERQTAAQLQFAHSEQQAKFAGKRTQAARLMRRVAEVVPADVHLESLSLRGERVTMTGNTVRHGSLTELLQRLTAAQDIDQVQLHSVADEQAMQRFVISFVLLNSVVRR